MSFGGRLLVGAVVAAVVAVGGLQLEAQVGARAIAPGPSVEELSGAWYCPHGGGEGWQAWVVVANPSDAAATLRVSTHAGSTPESSQTVLEPGTSRYLEVAAPVMASATVVEYFGAEVAAGMVVAAGEDGGVAAEPCAGNAGGRWYVPEASTLRGEQASAVITNPFAANAVVDLALYAGDRQIRPGPLRGLVLEPGRTKAVNLNRFALGEESLSVEVTALLGRVAVSGMVTSNSGVRAVQAVPEAAHSWALPGAGGAEGQDRLLVTSPSGLEAPFHATAQGGDGAFPVLDLESARGGAVTGFEIEAQDASVLVEADGPDVLVVGRRLGGPAPAPPKEPPKDQKTGKDGPGKKKEADQEQEEPAPAASDVASTSGVPAAAASWVTIPPVVPGGGPAVLLIQNPGSEEAEVRVTLLGQGGPQGEETTLPVAPGATARVDLPAGDPPAAVVEALQGSVVPAQITPDPAAYALSVGIPVGRPTG
ncbi:MAG: DUF5719 family protein [Actinomycetota bacterium]